MAPCGSDGENTGPGPSMWSLSFPLTIPELHSLTVGSGSPQANAANTHTALSLAKQCDKQTHTSHSSRTPPNSFICSFLNVYSYCEWAIPTHGTRFKTHESVYRSTSDLKTSWSPSGPP